MVFYCACANTCKHMGSHIVRTFRNMLCFKAGLMMAVWAAETCSHTWFNFISAYYWNCCVWTEIYIRFISSHNGMASINFTFHLTWPSFFGTDVWLLNRNNKLWICFYVLPCSSIKIWPELAQMSQCFKSTTGKSLVLLNMPKDKYCVGSNARVYGWKRNYNKSRPSYVSCTVVVNLKNRKELQYFGHKM